MGHHLPQRAASSRRCPYQRAELPLCGRPDGAGRMLGEIVVDVAYGGNFYAIVKPQKNFREWPDHTAENCRLSPKLRAATECQI